LNKIDIWATHKKKIIASPCALALAPRCPALPQLYIPSSAHAPKQAFANEKRQQSVNEWSVKGHRLSLQLTPVCSFFAARTAEADRLSVSWSQLVFLDTCARLAAAPRHHCRRSSLSHRCTDLLFICS